MIYSETTSIADLPCYLPEIGGYYMSKGEQVNVYLGLKTRRTEIRNEIAAIEVIVKAAGPSFGTLSRSLADCAVENLDWGPYQALVAMLPQKTARYGGLKAELAIVQAAIDKFVGFD